MTTLKIPLLLAVAAGAHITMTPPNPAPAKTDQLPPSGLEHLAPRVFPILVKALFWTCGLAEVAVLVAEKLSPNAAWTRTVLHFLDNGDGAHRLSLTRTFLLGAVLNFSGTALRLHCYARLRHFFTFELGVQPTQHLITTGVYSVVRHPSYTGALLAGVGVALCALTPGAWAVECVLGTGEQRTRVLSGIWVGGLSLACLGLRSRMIKEDRMLFERFGKEWEEWARRVPYWVFPGVY
ncbi:hypothetical protein C8F01DRAFT_1126357 [Mycena amicta]|nr:hypothetical protein C8F01DRAFT_1126357 [Mycena amicta]